MVGPEKCKLQFSSRGEHELDVLGDKDARGACLEAVDALSEMPCWLSGGTVLGLVREGGQIAADTDVDICVAADWNAPPDRSAIPDAMPSHMELFRETTYDGKPSQAAFFDVSRGIVVDIYYCYENFEPGFIWMFAEGACIRKPERLIRDRCKQDTAWGQLVMPSPVEDYLLMRYGGNWRQPEPSNGSWRGALSRLPW